MLTGCTVGPKYHPPAIQPPPAFKEAPPPGPTSNPPQAQQNNQANGTKDNTTETWTVAQPADAKIRGDWWAIFNEPELNDLEGQLNINNQNLKLYFENYMEARALVGEARAQYFPTVSFGPSYNRARSSGNLSSSFAFNTGKTSQIYSLPVDVSWTRTCLAESAARYTRRSTTPRSARQTWRTSALSSKRTGQFLFRDSGQDALIQLFIQTVAQYQKSLDLTQAQYETGVGDQTLGSGSAGRLSSRPRRP